MTERDMMRAICRGRHCHECPVKENNINCIKLDNNSATEKDKAAVVKLYYELYPDEAPIIIPEEDILRVMFGD